MMHLGRGEGQGRLPIFPGGVRLPGGPLKRQRPAVMPGATKRGFLRVILHESQLIGNAVHND